MNTDITIGARVTTPDGLGVVEKIDDMPSGTVADVRLDRPVTSTGAASYRCDDLTTEPESGPSESQPEPAARPDHLGRIAQRAARIKEMRAKLDEEMRGIRADAAAAYDDGEGFDGLVAACAGALSRPALADHLRVTDIASLASEAITAAELDDFEGELWAELSPRAKRVDIALHGPRTTDRLRAAQELDVQLRKRGLAMRTDSPRPDSPRPAAEVLGDGDETDIATIERKATVVYDWVLSRMGIDLSADAVRARDDDHASELAVQAAKVYRIDPQDETEIPYDLVVRRRRKGGGADYEAKVHAVLPLPS